VYIIIEACCVVLDGEGEWYGGERFIKRLRVDGKSLEYETVEVQKLML
jgi:hypothetical protein